MSPNPRPMPGTTNRPTPRAIISRHLNGVRPYDQALDVLDRLAKHGYVVVHPDDVPVRPAHLGTPDGYPAVTTAEFKGWNACRAHIFGDDQ